MRFFATIALLTGAVMASETATIAGLAIRDNNGLQSASFTVTSAAIQCETTSADELARGNFVACGSSNFNFAITGSGKDYTLHLQKKVGNIATLTGESSQVPLYCHAGGNGPNDLVCTQSLAFSVNLF